MGSSFSEKETMAKLYTGLNAMDRIALISLVMPQGLSKLLDVSMFANNLQPSTHELYMPCFVDYLHNDFVHCSHR